jgi:DNA polymerase-1
MVVDMMAAGMPIDPPKFTELSRYFQSQMDELVRIINKRVPGAGLVNPGSHQQTAKLLFDTLGMKVHRMNKTGPSTDDNTLGRLADQHPVVQDIRDWREYWKLKTSYADTIPKKVRHGRIHTTLRVTRVITGRLSSSDPNLMAQPVRTAEGRKIRDGYLAEPGCLLVSADYSQIEMRVTAHCSGDEKMLQIFLSNQDIHTQTAARMFGIPEDEVDEMLHRYPAKRVGFGVLTDIQASGLQRELLREGAPSSLWGGKDGYKRCEKLIVKWHGVYGGVAKWKRDNITEAHRELRIRDELQGRMRILPTVRSPSKWVRLKAEHQAVSAPIQMGAQAIIKEAMGQLVPVYREFQAQGAICRPLIQIHDDIVMEVGEDIVDDFVPQMKYTMGEVMEDLFEFTVPIEVDVKIGQRWGSMSKWEPQLAEEVEHG